MVMKNDIILKLLIDETRMLTNFNYLASYSINTFGMVEGTNENNKQCW